LGVFAFYFAHYFRSLFGSIKTRGFIKAWDFYFVIFVIHKLYKNKNLMSQSKNKYVDFVSDEHLLKCIFNLHKAYVESKKGFTKSKFYNNKVDTFKLTFDSKFNELSEEE